MTDKELLEYAAKAAGINYFRATNDGLWVRHDCDDWSWNPLTDDGDALRLSVLLGLTITPNYHVEQQGMNICVFTELEDTADYCAPTRRAIVRAAAEIGKAME